MQEHRENEIHGLKAMSLWPGCMLGGLRIWLQWDIMSCFHFVGGRATLQETNGFLIRLPFLKKLKQHKHPKKIHARRWIQWQRRVAFRGIAFTGMLFKIFRQWKQSDKRNISVSFRISIFPKYQTQCEHSKRQVTNNLAPQLTQR